MKYKFVILMALVALLSLSVVAATYDLQVDTLTIDPTSPINGENAMVKVSVENVGADNITNEAITLTIDFNDSTSTTFTISDLEVGDSQDFSATHTWVTSQSYTILANLTGMVNDSNPNTDSKSITFTVVDPVADLTIGSVANFQGYRGDSLSQDITLSNSGNMDTTVSSIQISDLTETSGESVSSSSISLTSITSVAAGSSETLTIDIPVASNQKPATYTGTLTIKYFDVDGVIQTLTQSITLVVDNHAPSVGSIADQVIIVGNAFSYSVVASDTENDVLTYALSGMPVGMTIDDTTGVISWTPTVATSSTVTVSVSDSYDTTTQSFSIQSKVDAPGLTASESSVTLGGSTTDRGTQVTQTYTVQNTGTQTITALSAEALTIAGDAISYEYAASVALSTTSLAPNEIATVSVTVTIPSDQSSKKKVIGKVRVSGTAASDIYTDTTLEMQAKSYLRISDVEIEINNDDTDDLSDGDNYDEIKEGDKVEIRVKLETIYSSSDDIEIENAYFEITDDNDWDIDEESSEVDIKEDDEEEIILSFTIPYDLDDDTTTVTIEAYGDDKEGDFEHFDEFSFDFEVDRPRNEITITSWEFDRDTVSCDASYATLNVRIKNTGTDDQEEVSVLVQSDDSELDWYKRVTDIELDEDDSKSLTFNIPVSGVDEGSYFVEITTYYDNTDESDNEVLALEVVCNTGSNSGTTTVTPTVPGGTIVVTPPTTTTPTVTQPTTPSTSQPVYGEAVSAKESFRNSNTYMIVLVVIVIVLLLIVLGLAVSVLTRK